jgi:hypothetical protein
MFHETGVVNNWVNLGKLTADQYITQLINISQ